MNAFSYLGADAAQAIFIRDYEYLEFYPALQQEPDNVKAYDYKKANQYSGAIFWDYALPVGSGEQLLCCFENYRVMVVDTETQVTVRGIDYSPGLSINGCWFRNVEADEETVSLFLNSRTIRNHNYH